MALSSATPPAGGETLPLVTPQAASSSSSNDNGKRTASERLSANNEFGTVPVPLAHTVSWIRVALTLSAGALSIPTFVAGISVTNSTTDLSVALSAIIIGNIILATCGAMVGTIGVRTKLSSYMLTRVAFGPKGAAVVNLMFAASLLGWFGVNVGIFSDAVFKLLEEHYEQQLQESSRHVVRIAINGVAGTVMTSTAACGFRFMSALSAVLVPVLGIATALLLIKSLAVLQANDLDVVIANNHTGKVSDGKSEEKSLFFGKAISSVVGTAIIGAIIIPDLTRFIRTWPGAVYASVVAYAVVGSIVEVAGGLASFAFSVDNLSDALFAAGMGSAAPLIIVAGTWILNSLNLYSAALSVVASVPRFESRWLTAALGVVGTVFAFVDVLGHFLTFLLYLAIIFTPVAGVVSVDYFILRKDTYTQSRTDQTTTYMYTHVNALVAWAVGTTLALLESTSYDHLTITGIVSTDAAISAGLTYLLLSKCSTMGTSATS